MNIGFPVWKGEKELSLNLFEVVEIEDKFPIERIRKLLNKKDSDK